MPSNNTSKKIVTYVKSKHADTRPSTRKHHDDDDRSQSEYSSVAPASNYRSEAYKSPKEPRRQEDEERLGSLPIDTRSQRRENLFRHESESFRSTEMPPLVRLATLPYMPVYEHCAVLRNHGISVKLGPDLFRSIAQQGIIQAPPVNHSHHCSAHNAPLDVHNPSAQEKQAVTEAIVFIVRDCGGEVEMPGFDPQPAQRCSSCSSPVSTPTNSSGPVRRDMDEHRNGHRNSFQNSHGSHPGAYDTNTQGNIPIGLASPYEAARSEAHWDSHGR
ncbi:hypothetical protein AYL99_09598 [Fonsecaea erecta]|uniref:Uncharacterized protein n=1 Tax=Fonsecaea erecta TaxID=1367422 RepID=A0A178Z9F9_9EURO|nr:hypothetical protein AYL99_09598 [Fonsecaea erecta]OAP56419.1 hypothetical protein AYL99_09598 [Fonsecaea erecta]